MVKLKAPSISLGAAGGIGGALVFSNWKGRAYAKKLSTPQNPKSGGQVGMRSMTRFLSTGFGELSTANIATWLDLAAELNVSTYNAWVSYNLQRWGRYLFPTKAFPASEAQPSGELSGADATPRNRTILVHLEMGEWNSQWGYHLHRWTSTGFTPSRDNTIRVGFWDDSMNDDLYYSDGPLHPDTYYYRVSTFSYDGFDENLFTDEFNATLP